MRTARKGRRIELLVTGEMADSWYRCAAEQGGSLGEFVRQSVGMDGKIRVLVKTMINPADREAYRGRTLQIARIGNNLNQFARRVIADRLTVEQKLTELLTLRASVEGID